MRILERIKKRYFRLSLAIQQLILRPYLNIFPLAILAGFWMFWNQKSGLYAHTPKLILPVWRGIVHIGGSLENGKMIQSKRQKYKVLLRNTEHARQIAEGKGMICQSCIRWYWII